MISKISGIFMTVFAIFWISQAGDISNSFSSNDHGGLFGFFPFFGLIFVFFGIYTFINGGKNAKLYFQRKAEYEAKRADWMAKIK